jgi:hypothetical protein
MYGSITLSTLATLGAHSPELEPTDNQLSETRVGDVSVVVAAYLWSIMRYPISVVHHAIPDVWMLCAAVIDFLRPSKVLWWVGGEIQVSETPSAGPLRHTRTHNQGGRRKEPAQSCSFLWILCRNGSSQDKAPLPSVASLQMITPGPR